MTRQQHLETLLVKLFCDIYASSSIANLQVRRESAMKEAQLALAEIEQHVIDKITK